MVISGSGFFSKHLKEFERRHERLERNPVCQQSAALAPQSAALSYREKP
jgi:hypothetical protein